MNGQELSIKFNELLDITRQSYETFVEQTERALESQRPITFAVDVDNIDPEKFPLDAALYKAAPIQAVPVHSEFAPLVDPGHRFLLANDGLYLEVRRPWLHYISRLAEQTTVRMPYGQIASKMELAFGRVGTALEEMREFGVHAMDAGAIEAAASLIWNDETRAWSIKYPNPIGEPTAARIQFEQVELAEHEHLVIDMHSHGHAAAFFSAQDDEDDAGSVKISGVFGNLDQTMPTVAFRLCVLGQFITIPVPAPAIFG